MGRTGEWFGFEQEGATPDLITLAKGLGAGLPLGAMITLGAKAPQFEPGQHGSTFGGNPIACAAASAAIDFIVEHNLLRAVKRSGAQLIEEIERLPGVQTVRGRGLLLGIVLTTPVAARLSAHCMKNGLLVNAPNSLVIRVAPPLNITKKEIELFVKIFSKSLTEVLEEQDV